MNCELISDAKLRAFLDECSGGSASTIADHINECTHCQSRLDRMTSGEQSARKIFKEWTRRPTSDDSTDLSFLDDVLEQASPRDPIKFSRAKESHSNLGWLGEFEIKELIGEGAYGSVFLALDPQARQCAIKVLRPELLTDVNYLKRFQREARVLAAVDHPHVARIYASGHNEELGLYYLCMEYVSGGSVKRAIQGQGLSLRRSAEIVRDASRGTQAAHDLGQIHRDIKPDNILLEANGNAKLADFGLARDSLPGNTLTQAGDIVGTLDYLSPEQVRGNRTDSRSDVYSLGATLYVLLTGETPFRGKKHNKLLQIDRDPPPPPRKLLSSIPRDLETITLKAMAKEPGGRYKTAGDLADDLQRFLDNKPISARRASIVERTLRFCQREPRSVAWAGLVVALLIGTGYSLAAMMSAQNSRARDRVDYFLELSADRAVEFTAETDEGLNSPALSRAIERVLMRSSLSNFERRRLLVLKSFGDDAVYQDLVQAFVEFDPEVPVRNAEDERKLLFSVLKGRVGDPKSILEFLEQDRPLFTSEPSLLKWADAKAGAVSLLDQTDGYRYSKLGSQFDEPSSACSYAFMQHQLGVDPERLIAQLFDSTDPVHQYWLILSVANYSLPDISQEWDELEAKLSAWSLGGTSDPGVRAAAEWALRHWGVVQEEANLVRNQESWILESIANRDVRFIRLGPAQFKMGSPEYEEFRQPYPGVETEHQVHLDYSFAIAEHEVTVEQMEDFLVANEPNYKALKFSEARTAYSGVSWIQAIRFCRWLTTQAGLDESEQCYDDPAPLLEAIGEFPSDFPIRIDRIGFRLPTEAEWEYACRAGSNQTFSFGCDRTKLPLFGWSNFELTEQVQVVKQLRPNRFGLFDVHGNVSEWCSDPQAKYQTDGVAINPTGLQAGALAGHFRAVRGGAYSTPPAYLRCADRYHQRVNDVGTTATGIRLVRTVRD